MNRIETRFRQLKAENRVALIPYVTAGDPNPAVTVPLMHAMVEAGANLIELGVPFSDPMADGPVIQRASERALQHNTSLRDVLGMVKDFRQTDSETPVILMGYLNPIEAIGYQAFAEMAADSGLDGVLTVDIPPEEADDYLQAMRTNHIDTIFLVAPTSNQERIKQICDVSRGFVYYVSVKGITGTVSFAIGEVAERVFAIRKSTRLPVGVGFGIKDSESAQAVAQVGDAVIVGSALVRQVEEFAEQPEAIAPAVCGMLSQMRTAIDLI